MELVTALAGLAGSRDLAVGEVTAVGASRLTVLVDAASLSLPAVGGMALYAVGDTVLVARSAHVAWVLGVVGAAPPPPPPAEEPIPSTPPSAPALRTVSRWPYLTASYRGGKWRTDTDDVLQGDYNTGYGINTGCAFYRSSLAGLNADTTRTGTRITVRVKRIRGGVYAAQAPTMWTVSQRTRPSGAPTRLASFTGPSVAVGKSAVFELPSSATTALLDGTAGGLAIHVAGSSPYIRLAGRSQWSASFALAVTYAPVGS